MSRPLAALLLAFALLAGPAAAATGLETARAGAGGARAKVNEIRARQMQLRGELNQVATRIEGLKAQQKGALLPGSELDSALRRSQELSGTLTEAAQALSAAEGDLERENLLLLTALSGELDALRARWERLSDRGERQKLVERMRALRQEREQVRAMLPASRLPALATSGSDDPEDLLEQVDLLRDNEDKVRQRMKALQARITELREERELDRRMNDFLGDESMFDEEDRRLRKERSRELAAARAPPLFGGGVAAEADVGASAPPAGPEAAPGYQNDRGTTGPEPTTTPASPVVVTQIARGVDARPQVSGGMDALLLDSPAPDNLEGLEAQLEKLKGLAEQLEDRAGQLEQRAKELE